MRDIDGIIRKMKDEGLDETGCLILRNLIVNGSGSLGLLSPIERKNALGSNWWHIPSPDPEVVEVVASQVLGTFFDGG